MYSSISVEVGLEGNKSGCKTSQKANYCPEEKFGKVGIAGEVETGQFERSSGSEMGDT